MPERTLRCRRGNPRRPLALFARAARLTTQNDQTNSAIGQPSRTGERTNRLQVLTGRQRRHGEPSQELVAEMVAVIAAQHHNIQDTTESATFRKSHRHGKNVLNASHGVKVLPVKQLQIALNHCKSNQCITATRESECGSEYNSRRAMKMGLTSGAAAGKQHRGASHALGKPERHRLPTAATSTTHDEDIGSVSAVASRTRVKVVTSRPNSARCGFCGSRTTGSSVTSPSSAGSSASGTSARPAQSVNTALPLPPLPLPPQRSATQTWTAGAKRACSAGPFRSSRGCRRRLATWRWACLRCCWRCGC